MKVSRLTDLIGKFIEYALAIAKHPARAPKIFLYVLGGMHLGEYLNLNKTWLKSYGVRTVIDVGANTGQFSSAISRVFPEARIFAFEPINGCFHALVKRMKGKQNFEAQCLAIGDKIGRVSFFANEFSKSSSCLSMTDMHKEAFPWTVKTEQITVDQDTLDNVMSEKDIERPCLLKLDIQGGELSALQGAENIIDKVDIIITEMSFCTLYEMQPLFDDIYSLLRNKGFSYFGCVGMLVSPKDASILQEDSVFLRSK